MSQRLNYDEQSSGLSKKLYELGQELKKSSLGDRLTSLTSERCRSRAAGSVLICIARKQRSTENTRKSRRSNLNRRRAAANTSLGFAITRQTCWESVSRCAEN